MDVSGPSPRVGISSPIYPVFDALRRMGQDGRYTFPDQATGAQRNLIGPSQSWTPDQPVTLINTAGPPPSGRPQHQPSSPPREHGQEAVPLQGPLLRAGRRGVVGCLDGGHAPGLARQAAGGRQVERAATYDVGRADWYEVMGIMPVAVYDGTDVGGKDALSNQIPQQGVLTHGHLAENRNHGGDPMGLPDPRTLPGVPRRPTRSGSTSTRTSRETCTRRGAAGTRPGCPPGRA